MNYRSNPRYYSYNRQDLTPKTIPNFGLHHTLYKCVYLCYKSYSEALDDTDIALRNRQIKLLQDCAKTCEILGALESTNSEFTKEFAVLCARVCEECAKECAKFTDASSQSCAEMCFLCAQKCKDYARE